MYPEKVIGYATIDPNYTKDMDAEIRKCHEKYGMKGLKPYYPYVKIPYNSPKYRKWWEYANEHRLFALLHGSGENFPREVEEISEKYPEVNFLLAHSGGNYTVARQNCELAKKKKNVFLEITLTTVTYGVIEFMAEEVGAEKIIFGTDAPMRDPIPQLGWLAYTRLSEEEKRKILGENMQKILDRCK